MTAFVAASPLFEPGYFGPENNLFGCWHPGQGSRAVVICMSLGHEYQRMHRAGRQLAVQLSQAGVSAFRFDYGSSGDSAGDEFSLRQAQRDIEEAIRFVKSKGTTRITLIGVRLGAALALPAMTTVGVDSMVLWEPVSDGTVCRNEWIALQRAYETQMGYSACESQPECLGFAYEPEVWKEIADIRVSDFTPLKQKQVQIIDGEHAHTDLHESVRQVAACCTYVDAPAPAIWRRESTDSLVPFQTLRTISTWVAGLQG